MSTQLMLLPNTLTPPPTPICDKRSRPLLSEFAKATLLECHRLGFTPSEFAYAFSVAAKSPACLPPRMKQILIMYAQGATGKDIARQLNLSTKTVWAHLYQVNKRLGLNGKVDLVRYCVAHRLIHIDIDSGPEVPGVLEVPEVPEVPEGVQ